MTDSTSDPWLERRARLAETLAEQHAKLHAQRDAATASHLSVVPDPVGNPDAGAREPNPGTAPMLAAIERANRSGNVAEIMAANGALMSEISRAARCGEDPDFNRPLDAA